MKLLLVIVFSLVLQVGYCQKGAIQAVISKSDSLTYGTVVFVELRSEQRVIFADYMPFDRPFRFDTLSATIYRLSARAIGNRTITLDSLVVSPDKTLEVTMAYSGPCSYTYLAGSKPNCLGGHRDNIVRVAYGFPTAAMLKRAKQGKIYLGGCERTGCDPTFYCKAHKRFL